MLLLFNCIIELIIKQDIFLSWHDTPMWIQMLLHASTRLIATPLHNPTESSLGLGGLRIPPCFHKFWSPGRVLIIPFWCPNLSVLIRYPLMEVWIVWIFVHFLFRLDSFEWNWLEFWHMSLRRSSPRSYPTESGRTWSDLVGSGRIWLHSVWLRSDFVGLGQIRSDLVGFLFWLIWLDSVGLSWIRIQSNFVWLGRIWSD